MRRPRTMNAPDYYYEAPVRHKHAVRWVFALYFPQARPRRAPGARICSTRFIQ
jgi:hypothetical protein